MRTIAIIPARGGSKGLPNKNIRKLGKKPLIQWSVDFASQFDFIEEILVSSDSQKILDSVQKVPNLKLLKRPQELATDKAKSLDVVLHSLKKYDDNTHVILLQPTTPFRDVERFKKAYDIFKKNNSPLVYASSLNHSIYNCFKETSSHHLESFFNLEKAEVQRQEQGKLYQLTGGLYIHRLSWLREYRSFLKPSPLFLLTKGFENIDIDSLEDFEYAEYFLKKFKI